MAQSKKTLKSYFVTGAYPTEKQFAELIDSFFHLNESTIPIGKVEELKERLDRKMDIVNFADFQEMLDAYKNGELGGISDTEFFELLDKRFKVNEDGTLLLIHDDSGDYACPIEKLVGVSAPYIVNASGNKITSVTTANNSEKVYIKTDTADAEIYCALGEGTPTKGNSVTLTNIRNKTSTDYTIKAEARKLGQKTEATLTITAYRQVVQPTFEVSGDEFDTQRTVTIKCATEGAAICYDTNGGTPATDGDSVSITSTLAANKLKAQAKLDGWADSEIAKYASAITVGSPMIYYGMSAKTELTSLDGLKSEKKKNAVGLEMTLENGDAKNYFYLVVPNVTGYTQPTQFTMSGYGSTPVVGTMTVGGVSYKTYRSKDPQKAGNLTVKTA